MTTFELEDLALTLPITQPARKIAEQFAHQQPTLESAERVRINTLCVLVVKDYLQMMSIPSDLKTSNSWNPVIRMCADVADIEIPGKGRLECRAVRPGEKFCYFPPETWEERIGYVIVQLDELHSSAKLLGFVPSVACEQLPLTELQPLEALLDRLSLVIESQVVPEVVNLSQWFAGIFTAGWEKLESFSQQPQFAFRSGVEKNNNLPAQQQPSVKRGKLIDLGIQIANQLVMLIVEIYPQAQQQTGVRLQLHPARGENYLPPGVRLMVLEQSGAVFLEAQARSADNYIQLQFRGEPAERFSVKVALNDANVTENFVI
jgi:hypothetical protein